MLAVLGFVTILLVLALIMSKKVSTLVALIFVPAITGFIAAFINAPNVIIQAAQAAAEKAGTAYVEPVITFGTRFTKALSILSADYMGKGLSSIVATGVMFIFAILFFSTCSDAGVFDPIINRILKFTGEDPVKVCIGTFLIGCMYLWWKSRSCGRNAARTRHWSAQSRRPSCGGTGQHQHPGRVGDPRYLRDHEHRNFARRYPRLAGAQDRQALPEVRRSERLGARNQPRNRG